MARTLTVIILLGSAVALALSAALLGKFVLALPAALFAVMANVVVLGE